MHFLNINVADASAKCPSCKTTFSTAPLAPGALVADAPPADHTTGAVFDVIAPPVGDGDVPQAFRTHAHSDSPSGGPNYRESAQRREGRQWTYRWFGGLLRLNLPGAFFVGILVGVFLLSAIREGPWWWALALMFAAVVGGYGALAHLLNSSTITFNGTTLVVKSGPIPWQSFAWSRQQITECRCVRHGDPSLFAFAERIRRLTIDLGAFRKNAFAVQVVDRAGEAETFLSGMSEAEANYLVTEVTRALAGEPSS